MGRKKLNRTPEEVKEQNRIRGNRFFKLNQKRLCKERMERYYRDRDLQNNKLN